MPAQTQIDPTSVAAQSTLDSLFGTLGKGLELWGAWTTTKTQNVIDKATIPTTATPPMGGDTVAGITTKAWVAIGAIGSVVLVVFAIVLSRRRG